MNLDECLKDVSDGELIMLYREDDEEAKNLLYYKYKFIINILMNKYRFQLNKMNVDYQEIYSECLVGFSDAIKNFQEETNTYINPVKQITFEKNQKELELELGR